MNTGRNCHDFVLIQNIFQVRIRRTWYTIWIDVIYSSDAFGNLPWKYGHPALNGQNCIIAVREAQGIKLISPACGDEYPFICTSSDATTEIKTHSGITAITLTANSVAMQSAESTVEPTVYSKSSNMQMMSSSETSKGGYIYLVFIRNNTSSGEYYINSSSHIPLLLQKNITDINCIDNTRSIISLNISSSPSYDKLQFLCLSVRIINTHLQQSRTVYQFTCEHHTQMQFYHYTSYNAATSIFNVLQEWLLELALVESWLS